MTQTAGAHLAATVDGPTGGLTGTPPVGHVRYVTPGADPVEVVQFLVDALTDPFVVAVLLAGAVGVALLMAGYLRLRPAERDVAVFRASLADYRDLLPWLLRLSLGLPLVGAGFSGYLFTPLLEPASPTFVRLFGIGTGFLLLFGLATRAVAAVALATYLVVLPFQPVLLLAAEYVPGLLAILLLGGGRPSADEILGDLAGDEATLYSRVDPVYRRLSVPVAERAAGADRLIPLVLRAGLGFVFVYLGVSQKLMNPGDALAVVAKYDLTAVVPVSPELWVVGAGLTEALVGVLLLAGLFVRASALVAILLFTTTLFGLPDDPVLAHVSLFGLVSALLITGAGPLGLDRWIEGRTADGEPGRAGPADRPTADRGD